MANLILHGKRFDNIDTVIFDKDGTLIDIHHYWCSMIKLRADVLCSEYVSDATVRELLFNALVETMGIDLHTGKMKPEGPVGIKPRSYIIDVTYAKMAEHFPSVTRDDVETVFSQVDEHSKKILGEIVTPLEGAKELLEQLRQLGVKTAIATTDLTQRAALAMDAIQMQTYFDVIAGADLVEQTKPQPDLVHYICEHLATSPSHCVILGDAMVDLQMAQKAQCRFIGVKTGLFSDAFLEQTKALADNLAEIEVTP